MQYCEHALETIQSYYVVLCAIGHSADGNIRNKQKNSEVSVKIVILSTMNTGRTKYRNQNISKKDKKHPIQAYIIEKC